MLLPAIPSITLGLDTSTAHGQLERDKGCCAHRPRCWTVNSTRQCCTRTTCRQHQRQPCCYLLLHIMQAAALTHTKQAGAGRAFIRTPTLQLLCLHHPAAATVFNSVANTGFVCCPVYAGGLARPRRETSTTCTTLPGLQVCAGLARALHHHARVSMRLHWVKWWRARLRGLPAYLGMLVGMPRVHVALHIARTWWLGGRQQQPT